MIADLDGADPFQRSSEYYGSKRIVQRKIRTSNPKLCEEISADSPLTKAILGEVEGEEYAYTCKQKKYSGKIIKISAGQ
jgi:transcription elongation GreA/GreB family factor